MTTIKILRTLQNEELENKFENGKLYDDLESIIYKLENNIYSETEIIQGDVYGAKLLKTKEVALILGCTQRNVALLVKAGKLTPVNNHKDFYLFDAKQIKMIKSKKLSKIKAQ